MAVTMRGLFFLLCIFAFSGVLQAQAQEIRDLYRGPREAAMGGASTAITEDDEAIYLNPAAMAGNKKSKFYLLNIDGQTSTDTIGEVQGASTAFKNISPATLNQFMGKNIFLEGTLTSAFLLPNFGVSAIVDEQLAMLVQNEANPSVQLGMQTTSGFQFSTGFSVLPYSRRSQDDLRVGLGYKIMFRRGGYNTLDMNQIFNISQAEVRTIMGNFGEGMAGDFGLQWIRTVNKNTKLMAGLVYQDIGGLHFNGGGQTQPENLAVGLGSKFSLGRGMAVTLGWDVKNLTQDVEWAKRNHIGFDLALADLDFFGGLNEGLYLTGGAAVDLWLLKLTALTYAEELGEYSGQMTERRYMLRITIKFDM
jgi:hypothetical protein